MVLEFFEWGLEKEVLFECFGSRNIRADRAHPSCWLFPNYGDPSEQTLRTGSLCVITHWLACQRVLSTARG